jgi:hypothetical protein
VIKTLQFFVPSPKPMLAASPPPAD